MSYQVTKVEILSIDLQIFSKYISCEPAFSFISKINEGQSKFSQKAPSPSFYYKISDFS